MGVMDVTEEGRRVAVLRMAGVSKAFAGVQALDAVDLEVGAGEVVALLGENGAGKSTLMKVLFGVQQPDAGTIAIDGLGAVVIAHPRQARALGIGLVAQEPSLIPQLDVAQNIFLGEDRALSVSRRAALRDAARRILAPIAPHLPVSARVSSLGMAERQIVEIARTLARGSRIIAFDEPTSSLTPTERDGLFEIIRGLKRAGKAIIYISHRMPEVREIADRVTILRDGRVVASGPIAAFDAAALNSLIAGRRLAAEFEQRPERTRAAGTEALRLDGVSNAALHGIDLAVHRGEILGIAGLTGSGRTELVRCIFGADPATAGHIAIAGRAVSIRDPRDAIAQGIALIAEDRRGQSLVPVMSVEQNFALSNFALFSWIGVLRRRFRRREIDRYIGELAIRPRRGDARIRDLSGGNQQKVVIARWLRSGAGIFLFDEPTRGIDVGAKSEIHALLHRLAAQGAAIIVISSELPELLTLADRIGVMRGGRLSPPIENAAGVTEERLMRLASGEETLP